MKLGVVMDPISAIHFEKDSTLAMLLEAQHRAWLLYYIEQKDLYCLNGQAHAKMRLLRVEKDPNNWYHFESEPENIPLSELDCILMRKDPPFDTEYIYTTYILELAQAAGVLVVNRPQALRDANEKLFAMWFSDCCPPTLVTRDRDLFHQFFAEQKDIVCKPLGGMGGRSVFRLRNNDSNGNVVYETLSNDGTRYFMVQRYIPEVSEGDKRILMINGEAVPYALARIAPPGEMRANLAVGGHGEGHELTERDRFICKRVGPELAKRGLWFVGLDVIGDFLTEINVTSPTCIRELDAEFGINISGQLLDWIETERA